MKTSTILSVLAALLAAGALFASGWACARRWHRDVPVRPDTVVVTKWVRDSIPVVKDSIVYRTKTVHLPVHDTTAVHDTTTVLDTVLVEVPIVEKTYYGENYRATVRGFEPDLVDILVKQRETTVREPYRKRWSFTVGPQAGYGITPNGFQPYAGAGFTFGYSF